MTYIYIYIYIYSVVGHNSKQMPGYIITHSKTPMYLMDDLLVFRNAICEQICLQLGGTRARVWAPNTQNDGDR